MIEPFIITSPISRKLPGDLQVVDLTPVMPTPLKHTTQEIITTSDSVLLQDVYKENTLAPGSLDFSLNVATMSSSNKTQRFESATRTRLDAFCTSMSSPLRQHTSTQSNTPGPQSNPIKMPLSHDQLDRARRNRKLALERLAARSDCTGESGSAVLNANEQPVPAEQPLLLLTPAACSTISKEQSKRAMKNREGALRKRRESLTETPEISNLLHEHMIVEAPRNVRQKREIQLFGT